jgi:chromosome segregation ATPase
VTSLELKASTQKSRIAELEGSLEMVEENTNKIRKNSLMFQEKISSINKDLDEKNVECQSFASKMASTEQKLYDSERRVESLATLQSHRWMEFSKMADNMKELSHNMLTQSKSNTRKAAIRADLDEELEM